MTAYFDKFLYTYLIFLFFVTFIIGMGAKDIFSGNLETVMSTPDNIPDATGVSIDRPEQGLLTGLFDWLLGGLHDALGLDTWFQSTFGGAHGFFDNIYFFMKLMTIDAGVGWLGTLIFAPAAIYIAWGILSLIRGGS